MKYHPNGMIDPQSIPRRKVVSSAKPRTSPFMPKNSPRRLDPNVLYPNRNAPTRPVPGGLGLGASPFYKVPNMDLPRFPPAPVPAVPTPAAATPVIPAVPSPADLHKPLFTQQHAKDIAHKRFAREARKAAKQRKLTRSASLQADIDQLDPNDPEDRFLLKQIHQMERQNNFSEALARERAVVADARELAPARLQAIEERRLAAERKRREEEAERRRQKEEAERRRKEEEAERKRQQEEAARRQEEAARRRQEAEAARRRQQEEFLWKWAEETTRRLRAEAAAQRSQAEQAEWRRQAEEATRQPEEATRQRQRQQAEAARRANATLLAEVERKRVLAIFKKYEEHWNSFKTDSTLRDVRASNFPWPMLIPVRRAQDITYERIREFVLHPDHPNLGKKNLKDRLRAMVCQWHPDKFNLMIAKICPLDEQDAIREIALEVSKQLINILKEQPSA